MLILKNVCTNLLKYLLQESLRRHKPTKKKQQQRNKNCITPQFFTGMTQLVSERQHCSAFRVRLHFSECRQRWQVTLKMTRPAHADGSQCCALGTSPTLPPLWPLRSLTVRSEPRGRPVTDTREAGLPQFSRLSNKKTSLQSRRVIVLCKSMADVI